MPDIHTAFADYPWVIRSISTRGGNYQKIEELKKLELQEMANRLLLASKVAELAVHNMDESGVEEFPGVGIEGLYGYMNQVERAVGIILDQCQFHQVYASMDELPSRTKAPKKPVKKKPAKKGTENGQ